MFLLERRDSGLYEVARNTRASWNEAYPKWQIRVTTIPPAEEVRRRLADPSSNGILWPAHLHDDWIAGPDRTIPGIDEVLVAHSHWNEIVIDFSQKIWPEEFFVDPFREAYFHGAAAFISAVILYLSDTTVIPPDRVDILIPTFDPETRSFPYSPFGRIDPVDVAIEQGRLRYYHRLVEQLLGDQPERLQQIHDEALHEGIALSESNFPKGRYPPESEQWWFLPILPA